MVVGGIDPLRDEGRELARRLEVAGREVSIEEYEGMPHDFLLFPGIDAGDRAVERINDFLRRRLG